MKDETWDQWKRRVGCQSIDQIVFGLECQIRDLGEKAHNIMLKVVEFEIRLDEDDTELVKLLDEYNMVIDEKQHAAHELTRLVFTWDDDR